jgi:signal transduction histidine kinase
VLALTDGALLTIPSLLRRAALRLQLHWRRLAAAPRDPYVALFEASPAPMAVTDARGVLLDVNRGWERLTCRSRAVAIGRLASEFGFPELVADLEDHPAHLLRPDGLSIEVRLSARTVCLGGEPRYICTWTDATERVRTEKARRELEEANRELESYNYSLSHDLRQPIAAIAGFADLLLEQADTLDSLAQTCAREIDANAARMNEIIESLRRLADSGRTVLHVTEVDVADQVAGVLEELSLAVPVGGAVKVGTLPSTQGDPVLLRQVWMNLLDNALKYSRHSPAPLVEITGERRAGAVEYTVRDNGVGFDMRDAGRLFSAFQRLASGAEFEGHGIGLAIVQRVVRRHGGKIVAESAPGKGATFRLTLPERPLAGTAS